MGPTRVLRTAALCLALGLLPGCAAITTLQTATTPLDAFVLSPAAPSPAATASSRHLVVEEPAASGAIATDRILIKPNRLQAQYLPGARWIDPAPALVQNLLTESLQNTGAFRHVGRPSVGPFPDYTLMLDLRDFQAEAGSPEGPPYTTRVTLLISIVRESDREIIASRTFAAGSEAESTAPFAIVDAFDAATDAVMRDAVAWILATFGIRGV